MLKTISTERIPPTPRLSTGIKDVDWMYGCSDHGEMGYFWGIPMGAVSLIEGAKGGGKTKVAIEIMKSFTQFHKVLYFQLESSMSEFESRVQRGSAFTPANFYISNAYAIKEQEKQMHELGPRLVVVDSVQQVDAFKPASSKSMSDMIGTYRNYVESTGAHIILLSQLNGQGNPVGGTKLPHLADIQFQLYKECGFVVFRVGQKHRYGPTGKQYYSVWQHKEDRIECQSEHCLENEFWCRTHNIPVKVPFAELAFDRILREQAQKRQPSVLENALKYAVKSTVEDVVVFGSGFITGLIQGANRKK